MYRELIEAQISQFLENEHPRNHAHDSSLVLADRVVQAWRNQSPPGRFLRLNEADGLWYDVGNAFAVKKTSGLVMALLLGKERCKIDAQQPLLAKEKETAESPERQKGAEPRDRSTSYNLRKEPVPVALQGTGRVGTSFSVEDSSRGTGSVGTSSSFEDASHGTGSVGTSSLFEDCLSCACKSGGIHPVQVAIESTRDGTECQASFDASCSVSMTILLPHHAFLSINLLVFDNEESEDSLEPFHPQANRLKEENVSFTDCSAITSFDVPESMDMCIDAGAFRGCSSTISVQLPVSKCPVLDGMLSFTGSSSLNAAYHDDSSIIAYQFVFRGQSIDVKLYVVVKISWTSNPCEQGNTHPDTKGWISISSIESCRLI